MFTIRLLALFITALTGMIPAGAQGAKPKRPTAATPSAPAPPSAKPVPFAVGETLTYDVSWSSFVTAGTATMSIREKKPSFGSDVYYIVAEGRPTGLVSRLYNLYYKVDTLLDIYTLLPQRASVFSQEGKRQRIKTTIFNHRARKAQYEIQTTTLVKKELAIAPQTQDALAALYVVRAIPFKAGGKFSIPICDAGETYTAQIQAGTVETIATGIGPVRALRMTPTFPANGPAARGLTLWLSDDSRKLPVRMQVQVAVGTFDLTLRSVSR